MRGARKFTTCSCPGAFGGDDIANPDGLASALAPTRRTEPRAGVAARFVVATCVGGIPWHRQSGRRARRHPRRKAARPPDRPARRAENNQHPTEAGTSVLQCAFQNGGMLAPEGGFGTDGPLALPPRASRAPVAGAQCASFASVRTGSDPVSRTSTGRPGPSKARASRCAVGMTCRFACKGTSPTLAHSCARIRRATAKASGSSPSSGRDELFPVRRASNML